MLRRSLHPAVGRTVVLLLGLLLLGPAPLGSIPAAGATTVPQQRAAATPLRITLDEVSPAVLRDDSDVVLRGTVTNVSDETWTTVNVLAFRSAGPITGSDELAEAADTAADEYVGSRLTQAGTFQTIPTLDPGQSVDFTSTIPREMLGTEPGVYWIGVHALGQTEGTLRDLVPDGRARTFLPVVPERTRPLPAAVVLPVRAPVRYTPDGSLADVAGWAKLLGPGGRLHNVLETGGSAGSNPVTWLVDPAVLDAVQRLIAGNPGTALRPPPQSDDEAETAPPSATPDPDTGLAQQDAPTPEEAAAAAAAEAWWARFVSSTEGRTVLSLPYGDVDLSALAAADSPLLSVSFARAAQVMDDLGIAAQPALAATEGLLSAEALSRTPPQSLVLLSERAVDGPAAGRLLGHPYVTLSSGVADGGPGPEPAGSRIAVRQRLLSEAALQLLVDDLSPLVVVPPATWDPDTSAQLATGLLDTLGEDLGDGLLRWRPLGSLVETDSPPVPDEALIETEDPRTLPGTNVAVAEGLIASATLLDSVLAVPADVTTQATDMALTSLSYFSRRNPPGARARTVRADNRVQQLLGSVRLDGHVRAVTLSGDTGSFGVTLVNTLDVPVVVTVQAEAGESLRLDPVEPVRLAPNSRRRLLLGAQVNRQGVHYVTLHVADSTGSRLGSESTVTVRAAQVSGLLWLIMGGGLAILLGAIGVRLFRRIRRHRQASAHPPAPESSPGSAPESSPGPGPESSTEPGQASGTDPHLESSDT